MKQPAIPAKRCAGRPRAFDRDHALSIALGLFWRHGFDGSGVDGAGCGSYAFGERRGEVGGYKDGGGVEQYDIAAGAVFAGKDGLEDGSVGLGVASSQGIDRGAFEAGVFGSERTERDGSVADFGEMARAGDGDLIETGLGAVTIFGYSVNDEGVASVEEGHGFGDDGDEMRGIDSHDLRRGSGGVGERADEMKDGADAESAADGHNDLHGRVQARGMEEGEPMLAKSCCALGGREAYWDAERFEDVG